MSGLPTNNPLGNLVGGLLGGQSSQGFALAQMQQQAAAQNFHNSLVNAPPGAYLPYAVPAPPNMTGTEFIKATLRISMEREIRHMSGYCAAIGSLSAILCMATGAAIYHFTHAWPFGFFFGIPAWLTGFGAWALIRYKAKKWIEVHLS